MNGRSASGKLRRLLAEVFGPEECASVEARAPSRSVRDPGPGHIADPNGSETPPTGPAPAADTVTYTPPGTDSEPDSEPGTGPRYRLVNRLDGGGMGEVHVAYDELLRREVALKRIRPDVDGYAQARARFLRESRITAGLEHPGIVPLHDSGRDEAGRPFYVMRLIRTAGGQRATLEDAIARLHFGTKPVRGRPGGGPALVDLLNRFAAACNAVAYAHSRGVLHRDLKPANILLGPYGETLVVDWGLARSDAQSLPPDCTDGHPPDGWPGDECRKTPSRFPLGTLPYSSPAMAAGRTDQVGPADDVYSLGATLYHILAGRAPFGGPADGTMIYRIQRGEFPPPRRVRPDVPRALDAICRKAMALRPGDRYATALDLAGDVGRHLADEPVGAFPDSLVRKALRWCRKHSRTVAGVTALLTSALAILAVITPMLYKAWNDSRTSFAMVRDAASRLLNDLVEDRLPGVPRVEPLRRELAARALNFYEELYRRHPRDARTRLDVAQAYRIAANLERMMYSPGADAHYSRSAALLRALVAERPEVYQARSLLAEVLLDEFDLLCSRSDMKKARVCLDEADTLADTLPPGERSDRVKARCLDRRGRWQFEVGRYEEAAESLDNAVGLLMPLLREFGAPGWISRPPSSGRRDLDLSGGIELASALRDLGIARAELVRNGPAEDAFRRADVLLRSLEAELSSVPNTRYLEGVRYLRATVLARSSGAAELDEAIEILSRLDREFPRVAEYRLTLASALNRRGESRAWTAPDRRAEAEADYRRARLALEGALIDYPDRPMAESWSELGLAKAGLGSLALDHGELEAARTLLGEAVADQERARVAHPDNPLFGKREESHRALLKRVELEGVPRRSSD